MLFFCAKLLMKNVLHDGGEMNNKRDRLIAVLLILPAFVLFATFVLIPVVSIFYFSLLDWGMDGSTTFIGLQNYIELFTTSNFWVALGNNFKFLILGVPIWTIYPMIIAILLFEKVRGWKLFQSAFYFPTVLSMTIMSTMFRTFFMYDGPVNTLMGLFGIPPYEFWIHANVSIVLIIIFINWIGFGGAVLLFMSGLANFPEEVFEASIIDGTSWFERLRYVQIPLMKPTIAVVLMLNIISVFGGLFTTIFLMTGGGPGYGTTTLEYLMYTSAFETHRFGYASAVAVVLFLIILALGILQSRITKVNEGEL